MPVPVPPSATVVVVDDEPMVRDVVGRYLRAAGYDVAAFGDGQEAVTALRRTPPDLVVLDVMLPGRDGFSVLAELRTFSDVPVILLTARSDELDRIAGLEGGADDYVVKPFSPRELVARVRAVLKRTGHGSGERLEYDGLVIDPATREVLVAEEAVELTRLEFDLLHHLARSPRQVFTRADLLRSVWDSSPDWQDASTVTTHVRRLRRKIEQDPDQPRWICTQWGVGYRFEP